MCSVHMMALHRVASAASLQGCKAYWQAATTDLRGMNDDHPRSMVMLQGVPEKCGGGN